MLNIFSSLCVLIFKNISSVLAEVCFCANEKIITSQNYFNLRCLVEKMVVILAKKKLNKKESNI